MSEEYSGTEKEIHPARLWWQKLNGSPGGKSADRGALAKLRRCREPKDILTISAAYTLMQRFPKASKERLTVLAIVLAHIREDDTRQTIASAIGRKKLTDEESALLTEGRFRRLLQSEKNEELLTNMVRLTRHMKGKVNVEDMAKTILYWNDNTRKRWAFDYYAVGYAAPNNNTEPNQNTDNEEART